MKTCNNNQRVSRLSMYADTDTPIYQMKRLRTPERYSYKPFHTHNKLYECFYIKFRGVTHVVIFACNYPLSVYMNCNSFCGSMNSELQTRLLVCHCRVCIICLSCFFNFWHYYPYILQHFNEMFFTLV